MGVDTSSFSSDLADVQRQLTETLYQQHTQVALDVADRHMEAAKALDARATEVAELAERIQRQASDFRASLTKEVSDIVCPILEEHLKLYCIPSPQRARVDDRGVESEEHSFALSVDSCSEMRSTSVTQVQPKLSSAQRQSSQPQRRSGSVRAQVAH